MKTVAALTVSALALGITAISASAHPSRVGAVSPHYVFSFKLGLNKARIGSPTAGYKAVFDKAVSLPNLGGGGLCFGLAYAVSPPAQKARKADLQLFCGDKPQITEAHFASSAFCSSGGTCIGTPGSLRKFAAELRSKAVVVPGTECIEGGETCTSIEASFGRTQVSVRSSNCRKFSSVAAIGADCVAGDVMIYREADQPFS